MKIFIFWAMMWLMSCAAPLHTSFSYVQNLSPPHMAQREIPVWIDVGFGDADQVSLQNAIDQWNYALNGYIVLKVESAKFNMETYPMQEVAAGRGWLILKINHDNPMVAFHDRPRVVTYAIVNQIGGNTLYIIRDRIQNEWVTGIAMHEMGHLLGARHLVGEDLMTPLYNPEAYRCIDYLTVRQVAEAQHLLVENLNYCVSYSILKKDQ